MFDGSLGYLSVFVCFAFFFGLLSCSVVLVELPSSVHRKDGPLDGRKVEIIETTCPSGQVEKCIFIWRGEDSKEKEKTKLTHA